MREWRVHNELNPTEDSMSSWRANVVRIEWFGMYPLFGFRLMEPCQ